MTKIFIEDVIFNGRQLTKYKLSQIKYGSFKTTPNTLCNVTFALPSKWPASQAVVVFDLRTIAVL